MKKSISPERNPMEYEELRARLEEAEDTLQAIRSGEVDALVVEGGQGMQVYTLKDAAHPYQVMVDEMNEGALTLSTEGTILYCNQRLAELLGLPMEKILGESFQDFAAPRQRSLLNRLLKQGEKTSSKGEAILKVGERTVPVEISIRGVNFDGSLRLVALVSDISERKQAEKTIHLQADQYTNLLSTSADGFWLVDPEGRIMDVNEAYCRMSGYSREELLSLTISDIEALETRRKVAQHIRKIMKNGSERFESRHRMKDGQVMDVELSTTYLPAMGNLIVFVHDISGRKQRMAKLENYRLHLEEMVEERTAQLESANAQLTAEIAERKAIEAELARSEKKYRELVKYAPVGIYQIDFRTRKFTSVNEVVCQQTGYTREELLNMSPFDILDQRSQELFAQRLQQWLAGEKPTEQVDYRVIAKDGHVIYAVLDATFTRDEQGAPIGATVVAYDLTERKHAEEESQRLMAAVQAEKDRLAALVENISDEVWFADSGKKFTLANPTALKEFGLDLGTGLDVEAFVASLEVLRLDGNPRPIDEAPPLRALQGEIVKNQQEIVRAPSSGQLRYREVSATPVKDPAGVIVGSVSVVRDITERKVAEAALARSNAKLAEVLDSIQDDFYVLDREWKFVYTSRSFTSKVGKEPKDFIGNCLWEMFPKHVGTTLEENFRASMEKGEIRRFEIGGQYTQAWYGMTSFPSAEGITVLGTDITERKRAEEALRLSEARFRLALKNAPVSVATQGKDLRFQWAFNQRTVPPEQVVGKTDHDLFAPEDAERLVALKKQVLATGQEVRQTMWITSGGKRVYLDLLLEPIRDAAGDISGVGIATIDLTPIHMAQEALRESEELFRAIASSTPDHILVQDRDLRYTFVVNPQLGLTEQDMLGKTDQDFLAQEEAEHLTSLKKQVLETGEALQVDAPLINAQGKPEFFSGAFVPRLDAKGQVNGLIGYIKNVTELKQADETLRQSEERYRRLVEQSPDAIFVNRGGKVALVNRAALDLFGATSTEQVLGRNAQDFFHPSYHALITERTETLFSGGSVPVIEIKVMRLDGTLRTVEVTAALISDVEGPAAQVILHDVTDRKEREAELKQLNRTLKALGDINQAMVHATDEKEYTDEVCKIVVEDCGHRMAWIGLAQADEGKSVKPVASAGFEDGYLETLHLTWADTERGRGPTGTAIRTGRVNVCPNMITDPRFAPWRKEACKRGYAASIALPLISEGTTFGAFTIYSREPDPFSERETELLGELASDLAYGITMFRTRKAHEEAQKALQESEERFRSLFNSMSEGFALHEIICDEQGKAVDYRFLEINEAFERLTGLNRKDVVGNTHNTLLPGDSPRWMEEYGQVALTGQPVQFDNYSPSLKRHYDVRAYRPAPGQFAVIFMDVTERKEMEETLRVNLAKYTTLFNSFPLGITVCDQYGKILETNQEASKILGITEQEHLRRDIDGREWQIIRPDGTLMPADEYASVRALKENRRIEGQEMGLVKGAGQVTWLNVTAAPLPAEGYGVVVTYGDITRRKALENELEKARAEAERRANELNTIFNSIADGIVVYDTEGRAQQANRGAVNILGFDPAEKNIGELANTLSTRTMDGQPLRLGESPTGRALSGQTVSGERFIIHSPGKNEAILNTSSTPLWLGGRIAGAVTVMQDVTELYKAEETQAWLASFPEINPLPITEVDQAGRIRYMNPACRSLFPDLETRGEEHAWLTGREAIHLDLIQGKVSTVEREVQVEAEYYLQSVTLVPQNGRLRFYGFPVTVLKQAEEALETSNERLALMSETVSQLLASPEPQKVVEELCRKVLAHLDCQVFFNYLVDEKAGRLHLNAYAGVEARYFRRVEWLDFGAMVCGKVAQEGVRIVAEDIPVVRDPRTDLVRGFGVQAYACHPLIVEGKVIGTLSFGTRTRTHFSDEDLALMKAIADHVAIAMGRYKAEQALRQARDELELRVQERTGELQTANERLALERQRFNNVLDDLPAYLILLTPDYHVSFANRYFENHFGKSEGRRCYEYLFNRNEPCEICATYKTLSDNASQRWEWTGPDKHIYDIHDFPFTDVDGSKLILEMGIDITERKQAEEAVWQANAYNRSLIEASLDPLATITPDGKIGDVNSATEKVTGRRREELIGTDFHSYFSNPEKARQGYQKVFEAGSVHDYELEIRHKDGHSVPVLYNASIYKDEQDRVQGVFAVARDITDRKQFEAQLVQAEKHAVIGRMVGSVTHEINNPLQTIKNCLYLIQQDTPSDSSISEPLEMAASETARLADLVGQLRELYRPRTDLQNHPHEVLDVLEEVHALLTPHLNNSKVKWKPLTGIKRCYINCIRDQILEVFLNICMNAIEAMKSTGGILSVDMKLSDDRVGIVFQDSGPGIPGELLPHIFEPFMTTKSSGLGLGLSISYGIVQRHGGQILAENCPEGGASFTVWLPVARKKRKETKKHGH